MGRRDFLSPITGAFLAACWPFWGSGFAVSWDDMLAPPEPPPAAPAKATPQSWPPAPLPEPNPAPAAREEPVLIRGLYYLPDRTGHLWTDKDPAVLRAYVESLDRQSEPEAHR